MTKRLAQLAVLAAAALALTGCGKNVDIAITGATKVPGTYNLYRFCDGTTLIYFSKISGASDEYEFIVYDGCKPTGQVPPQHGVQNLPDQDGN